MSWARPRRSIMILPGLMSRWMMPSSWAYARARARSRTQEAAWRKLGGSCLRRVESGTPALGRWQRIFFCEFDGPRTRQLRVGRL